MAKHQKKSSDSHEKEIWLPISGWPYEVSSLGQVRRSVAFHQFPAGFVLKQKIDLDGYPVVTLWRNRRKRYSKVSVLVCSAFHGDRPTAKHQAAHEDGVKTNNRSDNLTWKTPLHNNRDKRAHGTIPRGERHSQNTLTDEIVRQMRRDRLDGVSLADICLKYGKKRLTVYDAIRGTTWSHVLDPAGLRKVAA